PNEKTGRPQFEKIDLAPYANDSIDWVLNEPTGEQLFDGVPFTILVVDRAAMKSASIGRPTWPTAFSLPVGGQTGVRRVHAMLTGGWVDKEPTGRIGTLEVTYRTGEPTSVDMVKNRTIQEGWRTERELFGSSTPPSVPGVRWRSVYTEEQMRGPDKAFATLDVLTIDVDASRAIERVNLTRRSNQAGFALVAITLER